MKITNLFEEWRVPEGKTAFFHLDCPNPLSGLKRMESLANGRNNG